MAKPAAREPLRRNSRANRARSLATARRELGRNPDVTLEELARAAGVVRRTPFGHFPGKEALLEALAEEAAESLRGALAAGVPSTRDESAELSLVRLAFSMWPVGDLDHVTEPHHQPAAPFPQGGVEVGQGVGQERRPVGHGETGAADAGVDDEERDHVFRVSQSGPQDRVVVHPQVRGEQGDATRTVPRSPQRVRAGSGAADSAAAAMLRAMPPKTAAWNGATPHQ